MCTECEGAGNTEHHKEEYKYWTEQCETCEGSGRLLKTINIEIVPYHPDPPDRPRETEIEI